MTSTGNKREFTAGPSTGTPVLVESVTEIDGNFPRPWSTVENIKRRSLTFAVNVLSITEEITVPLGSVR